jgi:16S rRNA processing protein RimM
MSDSATTPQSWTVLAHLLRPQGRKGEILAELLTDFPDRFSEREQLFLAPANFDGEANDPRLRAAEVVSHWLPVGRNHGRIVLHLAGADTIEHAEALAGLELIVPSTTRVPLDEASDEQYIDDLLDCAVFDLAGPAPDVAIGVVTAVDFPTTPDGARRLADAAPLLTVLTPAGDEVLIPYVQSFLVTLAPAAKRIEMRLPAGLLDLNRQPSADH